MTDDSGTGRAMPALIALAVGGFAIGTGEFAIMGILPGVASNLSVSIPTAGHLISAYALGVVVGAPVLIALSTRLSRKTTLVALMAAFAVGNALSAISPGYHWLLVTRFLSGLPHGAYFGVGAVVAGGLVEPARRTRAMAMMFAGLTISNIIGVPLSTFMGQHLGWRPVFATVAGIGALAAISVLVAVPSAKVSAAPLRMGAELRALRRPLVWLALLTATLGGASLFTVYSYIAPMLTRVSGYAPSSVTLLLVLFGIGMTTGNVVGARLVDRALMPALYSFLAILALVSALLILTVHNRIACAATLFVFAATTFALAPALQSRIIAEAGDAPNLASGAIQGAFNVANALGAWLGGLVIAAGLGYTAPAAVASALAVCGLAVAVYSGRLERGGRLTATVQLPSQPAVAQSTPVQPAPVQPASFQPASTQPAPTRSAPAGESDPAALR